jgi:hypothetical protein
MAGSRKPPDDLPELTSGPRPSEARGDIDWEQLPPPVLKITYCVLIGYEKFLFYSIRRAIPRIAF